MQDPFFIGPVPWLAEASRPLATLLNLPTLPNHIHEVLIAALFYTIIYYPLSPLFSRLIFSSRYTELSYKKQLNWHAHVVSLIQSTLINILALWVMFFDEERKAMNREERVWGYTGAAGMVQAFAAGYFVWDLVVTSSNLDVFGWGTLAHAIAALAVYLLGFRPFLNYYGCIFILWELSTPFLNIHWFCDKLGMTGSKLQLYNGITLIVTFFCCRLLYGTYQSVNVFTDIWAAMGSQPPTKQGMSSTLDYVTSASTVPSWLATAYLISNLTLNGLNSYWFLMMIKAIQKRFVPPTASQTSVDDKPSSISSGSQLAPPVKKRKV